MSESTNGKRPTVALIGCGPAGMCFLHALVTQNQKQRDNDKVGVLPYVTCFERADEPGGCWRCPPIEQRDQPHNVTCWYEDMWTNLPKEGLEFSDYTFEKHFGGKQVPTYLPRADIFDYFLKRSTSIDPNIFQGVSSDDSEVSSSLGPPLHEVRYGTVVTSVRYDESTSQFEVGSAPFDPSADKRVVFETTKTEHFDYCIWAAGMRGKPRIPRSILHLLRTGGRHEPSGESDSSDASETPVPFKGTLLHSVQAPTHLEQAVKGKRIVLIGDSCSAEDLALQSVKLGADMCYILSRSGYGTSVFIGAWPGTVDVETGEMKPKVEVHQVIPYRVLGDGRSLKCCGMEYDEEEEVYHIDNEVDPVTLRDIDTIIFCTGYVPNMDFLSDELQIHNVESWVWSVPDFVMRENPFTAEVGDVTPSPELSVSGNLMPGLYRTLLVSNPRMMFLMDMYTEFPLVKIDASAWLCLAYITGQAPIPSAAEMDRDIEEQMLEEMNIPYLRWSMDRTYFEALDELEEPHWSDDYEDPRTASMNEEYFSYYARVMARDMKEGKYPLDLGTYDALSEQGNKLVQFGIKNFMVRHSVNPTEDDAGRTFRDADPTLFQSMFTGQYSSALPGRWMDLEPKEDTLSTETKNRSSHPADHGSP